MCSRTVIIKRWKNERSIFEKSSGNTTEGKLYIVYTWANSFDYRSLSSSLYVNQDFFLNLILFNAHVVNQR